MTIKIKRAPTAAQEIGGFMSLGQHLAGVISLARAVKWRRAVRVNSRKALDNTIGDSPTKFNGHLPIGARIDEVE